MAAGLTGRTKLFLQLVAAFAAAFVAISVISSYMMTYQGQRLVEYVMAVAVGLAPILGTAWLYAKAFRRRMISRRDADRRRVRLDRGLHHCRQAMADCRWPTHAAHLRPSRRPAGDRRRPLRRGPASHRVESPPLVARA